MIAEIDRAYIAGLFDGEGHVQYKQYMRQRKHNKRPYPTWSIRMEMAMTDKSILIWVHEMLGVGTVTAKRYKTKYTVGWKKQWIWRCCHRDAYYVSKLLWPFAHVKLEDIQKIIAHYAKKKLEERKLIKGEVVNLNDYRLRRVNGKR